MERAAAGRVFMIPSLQPSNTPSLRHSFPPSPPLFLLQRKDFDLDAAVLFVVVHIARVGHSRHRIVPAVADDLELVRIKLVFGEDAFAYRVSAIIGKLAYQVRRYD